MSHNLITGRAITALIVAAACWGGATVITKSVLTTLLPLTLLVLQLSVSVLLLWLLVTIRPRQSADRTVLLQVGALGLLNPGISYTLSLIGLTTTSVSISTLLWASEPVLILLLAWLFLGERLTIPLLVCSAIALLGVILIAGSTLSGSASSAATSASSSDLVGSTLILLGVLCCAFYTVFARRLGVAIDPLFAVTLQQSVALLWALAIWSVELRTTGFDPLRMLSWSGWLGAGTSGILYYALAFWFYLYGLARVPASLAGACLNLIPVFGVGGATLFLHERLTVAQWIGASAILLALYAIFFVPVREAKSTADNAERFSV